jgi:hypothetical protein
LRGKSGWDNGRVPPNRFGTRHYNSSIVKAISIGHTHFDLDMSSVGSCIYSRQGIESIRVIWIAPSRSRMLDEIISQSISRGTPAPIFQGEDQINASVVVETVGLPLISSQHSGRHVGDYGLCFIPSTCNGIAALDTHLGDHGSPTNGPLRASLPFPALHPGFHWLAAVQIVSADHFRTVGDRYTSFQQAPSIPGSW